MRELTDKEMDDWGGVVNYISHHGVRKSTSNSTPLRVVSNSSLNNNNSGHSFNSILAKGPNSIQPLFNILVMFRTYEEVVVWDIHKAYNVMETTDKELHCRRLVWRWGQQDQDWKTYGFTKVHFGDLPAAPLLELTKKAAVEEGRHIDPEVAEQMEKGYVDDGLGGGKREIIERMVGDVEEIDGQLHYSGVVSQILGKVSMRPKYMVRSGETDTRALDKLGGHVLGHTWDPPEDKIRFKLDVDLANRKEKIRGHQNLVTVDNIDSIANTKMTKRLILSIVSSWYDPLGLICAITI